MVLDIGLLVLRVAVGLLLAGHGAQKAFGWFGGYGFQGFSGWLASIGLKPAPFWGLLAVAGELGGGLLLALGLLTPLGGLAIIGAMAMAIGVAHWGKGVWNTNGGYEFPLILLIIGFIFGLVGPGAYSLDVALGIVLPQALFWGGLVVTVLVVGYGLFLTKQRAPSQQAA